MGNVADFSVSVFAARRTWRDFPIPIQFDVIRYVIFSGDSAVGFAFFQRPLIYRSINLAHIVDASVRGRSAWLFDEIEACGQRKKTNSTNYNRPIN